MRNTPSVDRNRQVDALIVTFNSADCVFQCLEAVNEFIAPVGGSLIVVDNASQDDTVAVVRSAFPSAVVVQNDRNVGFAAAVNIGLDEGSSPYVLLVNPDVSSIVGDVRELLSVMESWSDTAAVATRIVDDAGRLVRTCRTRPTLFTMLGESLALHDRFPSCGLATRHRMLEWNMLSERCVEAACGGFLLLRRAVIDQIGKFDERFFLYYEETDWLIRAGEAGWKVRFTPKVVVTHGGGKSSKGVTNDSLSRHLLTSQYAYLKKHFGWWSVLLGRLVFSGLDLVRIGLGSLPGASDSRRKKAVRAREMLKVHLGLTHQRGENDDRSS